MFKGQSDFDLASVINFEEEVLKITHNKVAVEKIYLFVAIHLLLVHHIVPILTFLPQKCNIKFAAHFSFLSMEHFLSAPQFSMCATFFKRAALF